MTVYTAKQLIEIARQKQSRQQTRELPSPPAQPEIAFAATTNR
jgi:hypothetical protein